MNGRVLTEADLAPLPNVAIEQRVMRSVVLSACEQPGEATLLFAADVLAGRHLAYEQLVCERVLWVDRFVDANEDARDHPEYLRRLHGENAARQLVAGVEACQAILAEFLV